MAVQKSAQKPALKSAQKPAQKSAADRNNRSNSSKRSARRAQPSTKRQSTKQRLSKTRQPEPLPTADVGGEIPICGSLADSPVYRRLPLAERVKLDRAIIFRPAELKTIPAILRHFALQEKYDLTADQVEAYAERVEQLVRPEVTSQIMAGVLGCLPKAYRRQLVAGGEVLLVSRVLQALNMQESGLSVAEMAKLASILLSLGRQSRSEETGRRSRSGKQSQKSGARDVDVNEGDGGNMDGVDSIQLAESLRLLYGLQWPPHPISPLTSPSTSSPTSASTSAPITTTEAYDSVQPDIGRP